MVGGNGKVSLSSGLGWDLVLLLGGLMLPWPLEPLWQWQPCRLDHSAVLAMLPCLEIGKGVGNPVYQISPLLIHCRVVKLLQADLQALAEGCLGMPAGLALRREKNRSHNITSAGKAARRHMHFLAKNPAQCKACKLPTHQHTLPNAHAASTTLRPCAMQVPLFALLC
eukprot:1150293-Pelagomonas_calceolata.AAC.5